VMNDLDEVDEEEETDLGERVVENADEVGNGGDGVDSSGGRGGK